MARRSQFNPSQQRWGFKVPVTAVNTGQVQFSDLISVASEDPHQWTLHLNALRFQNGSPPIGQSQPADNQTQSLAGSPQQGWKANILFGVGDGNERVVVDYYARGNAISLHAAYVRVGINGIINAGNNGLPPPILSGYITPHPRVLSTLAPTFTTPNFVIAASVAVNVPIPDRGVAYRIFNPTQGVTQKQVSQADAGGSIFQNDVSGTGPGTPQQEQGNVAGYYPLSPAAQFVVITNLDVAQQSFGLQFLLDLG